MNAGNPFSDETLARLSEYLDGTLSSEDRRAVERDLETDAALRLELEALRRVDSLIQQHHAALPELDWDRFSMEARERREAVSLRSTQSDQSSRSRRLIFRLYAPLAAAAVLAFAITAGLLMRTATTTDSHTLTAQPSTTQSVVVVTLERAGGESFSTEHSVAIVEVSRVVPPDALATAGPAPRGRSIVVAVMVENINEQSRLDVDEDALF